MEKIRHFYRNSGVGRIAAICQTKDVVSFLKNPIRTYCLYQYYRFLNEFCNYDKVWIMSNIPQTNPEDHICKNILKDLPIIYGTSEHHILEKYNVNDVIMQCTPPNFYGGTTWVHTPYNICRITEWYHSSKGTDNKLFYIQDDPLFPNPNIPELVVTRLLDKKNLKIAYTKKMPKEVVDKEVEYMCKNGVKNGRYISFYPDEKIKISGNFVNDECDGLWIEYDTIGRKIFETNYRNDKKNGSFVEYGYNEKYKENNGLCYKKIGSYVNDEKNGFWQRLFLKDGKWRNLDFSNYRNGILHGAAKEWKLGCDTIVFCNYNNGKLDGKYQVKGSLLRLQKAIYDDNLIVITDGCYNDGKKTGFWQYKDLFTFKLAEGVYENDKEEGEWKYYSYNNIFSHIANYHDGKLNGKYIAYKEQIAKNSLIPKETHAETIFIKDSIDFICYFKDGKRHGHYERHDNNGIVVMEGDYNNDKEQGQWIVIDIDNDEKCIANFNDGKLDGNKLVYSYATGKKLYTYNYRNGTCDGCQVWYKDSEKPFVEDWFQDGVMHKRVIFNSDGSRTEFNLLKRNFDSFLGRETSFLKENTKGIGSIAIEYKYNIDPDSVLYIPFVAFGKGQKILDGKYVVRDLENREIDEMEYSEGKKVGVWKHTDYKNNVCSYEDKSDLSKPKRFLCLDNQPYSGKFVIEDEKQEKRIVHKIKKSLIKEIVILDYKTGKVISKQKYKDGMPL